MKVDQPGYTPGTMSSDSVSLVIPGRNCAATIRRCLSAVVPLVEAGRLREIIFVDDGSTDDTPAIVSEFAVTRITGEGLGPGAARNLGWRAAKAPLVWFVDSDCVVEPDALELLLPEFHDSQVAGASGSYGIMNSESLLACLIHEEIIERHRNMPRSVDFLASFNVVYRRSILQEVHGFDERFLKGQDAELSWRLLEAGYGLRFVLESRVKHYHETRWLPYLKTQNRQGYWRVFLHLAHRGHGVGDSYSRLLDHLQPPLAMLVLASCPLIFLGKLGLISAALVGLLVTAQFPLTFKLLVRLGRLRYLGFAWMSFLRAFWRGIGMTQGLFMYVFRSKQEPHDA